MTTLKIIDIEGIGSAYAAKLVSTDIKTSDHLLKQGKTPQGRKEISKKADISEESILKWVQMTDLMRIRGVGAEFSELIEDSGVNNVVELSQKNAEDLQEQMVKINDKKNLVRRTPTLNEVKKWVLQAKKLPKEVEYSTKQEITSTETYPDLEDKIAQLEAKLAKLSAPAETKPAQPKPQAKPAEPKKDTLPKGFEKKPAEAPKPAETKKVPATFNEALEEAYYTAPMSDFHKYRTSVTGYSPAPNRYFVRHTDIVGKVPTTNWNDQKATVTGYTQPSNQYFATRQRLAYHPADRNFGTFSGVKATVEGVAIKDTKQPPPKEAPKPTGTLPKGTLPKGTAQTQPSSASTQSKSKSEQLEEYEKNYLQRLEQEKIDQQKAYAEELKREAAEAAARSQASASSNRGTLPKGFEAKPEPAKSTSSKGTLPKGF